MPQRAHAQTLVDYALLIALLALLAIAGVTLLGLVIGDLFPGMIASL